MMDMYYNEDCSLSEIADTYNISRQGVRSVLKKGETIITEMEEKLGLVDRFIKVRKKSNEIATSLESINANDADISTKLNNLIQEIKELADY